MVSCTFLKSIHFPKISMIRRFLLRECIIQIQLLQIQRFGISNSKPNKILIRVGRLLMEKTVLENVTEKEENVLGVVLMVTVVRIQNII